jgi:hypothetical protein
MDINKKFIRRSKRTAFRIYGNKAVVLLLPKGSILDRKNRLFELSPLSTFVWKLIEEPLKIRLIIERLAKEKKISYGKKKAVALIRKLLKLKIVEIMDIPEKFASEIGVQKFAEGKK